MGPMYGKRSLIVLNGLFFFALLNAKVERFLLRHRYNRKRAIRLKLHRVVY